MMLQEAYAYKKEKISHAEGEAKRFLAQLTEYSKTKEISKTRLYLDFIHSVYPSLKEIIIVDSKEKEKLLKLKIFQK